MRRSNAFSKNRRRVSRRFIPKDDEVYKGIQLGFDEILKDGYKLDNSVNVEEIEKDDLFKRLDFNDIVESAYKEKVEPELILNELQGKEKPESVTKDEENKQTQNIQQHKGKEKQPQNSKIPKSTKSLLIILGILLALLIVKMLWSSGVLKWILIVLICTFGIIMFNSVSSKLDEKLISKPADDLVDSVNGEESKSSGLLKSNLLVIVSLIGVVIFLVIGKPIGSLICGALAILSFKN